MVDLPRLKVLQVLPELQSGGVERGTVDFARYLVEHDHQSMVMSAGGRLVEQLNREGSQHISFPVHKKSFFSFLRVGALRRLLVQLKPDIIHVRSRMPAWLVWRALKRWPLAKKPVLISTFHGLYSINFYSAIMGCGDGVIAISHCVRDYIVNNYPAINPDKISVVHRGVDVGQFNVNIEVGRSWRKAFENRYPETIGKRLILMPGRLSPWKGQRYFIELMECLLAQGKDIHGLIVGEAKPGKEAYAKELKAEVASKGLSRAISFLGHRDDMEKLYKISSVVLNVSEHPEPFGRTVIEALAVGSPVASFNCGGPAESLRECLPEGLVAVGDIVGLANRVAEFVQQRPNFFLPDTFTLNCQAQETLKVYRQAILASQS